MSKDEEIRNVQIRRKNLLFLMQRYLLDSGFYQTAATLKTESRLSDEYELCDNIDLDGIYLEYASYYHLKFGKYPRILRKVKQQPIKLELAAKRKKSDAKSDMPAHTKEIPITEGEKLAHDLQVTVKKIETSKVDETQPPPPAPPSVALIRLQEIDHGRGSAGGGDGGCGGGGGGDELLCGSEWQNLVDLVRTTILRDELKLNWLDMCGNKNAIELVKEAVVAPIKYPQLFANGLKPWRSVLLHGPPGSGKTLLAKILYAETRTQVTFFNVTASVVISKWRGESEKILRVLFHVAQKHAPAIIFLDEIEGLTSKRDRPSDHESSKRFKNELLQLLDGMGEQSANVFILASTNLPWDIDDAFLRRFEKKLLVQLPNAVERAKLIGKLLPITVNVTQEKMEALVKLSNNFTGDEIRLACKEIAMQTVRRITKGGGKEGTEVSLEQAFEQIKPLSLNLMDKHKKWQQAHGS